MTKFVIDLDVYEDGKSDEENDDLAHTYLRKMLVEPISNGDVTIIRVNAELGSTLNRLIDSEGKFPQFRKGDEIYAPCVKLKGKILEQRKHYYGDETFWGNVVAEMEDGIKSEFNSWQCRHKYIHNRLNDMLRKPNEEYMKLLIEHSATAGEAMSIIMKDYHGQINPALVHPLLDEKFK